MADLIEYCNLISQLDDTVTTDLLQNTTTRNYKKGDYLFQQGKVCEHLYFINEGLVKCFFFNESIEKEFVLGFLTENTMFSLFDSFVSQTVSNLNLIALENTSVTLIRYDAMENLCKRHHCVETLYRKLISTAMTGVMKLICEMLENNTTERYNNFVDKHRETMQRISLGDVAKLFGITQQSLSRIRASK
jgi:CRP-like cAMP-binding protein